MFRVQAQGSLHDATESLGEVVGKVRRPVVLAHDRSLFPIPEGQTEGEALEQDHAQGVDVRPQVRTAAEHLGRHVVGCSATEGERVVLLVEQLGQAVVPHPRHVPVEEDVARLQVEVSQAAVVQGQHPAARLHEGPDRTLRIEVPASDPSGQGVLSGVAHDQVGHAAHDPHVLDGDEVRMVDRREQPHLVQLAFDTGAAGPRVDAQELDRVVLADRGLRGLVDLTEGSAPEVVLDLVAGEEPRLSKRCVELLPVDHQHPARARPPSLLDGTRGAIRSAERPRRPLSGRSGRPRGNARRGPRAGRPPDGGRRRCRPRSPADRRRDRRAPAPRPPRGSGGP